MKATAIEPIAYGTSDKDQRRYEPGEEFELDEKSAAALLAMGHIAEAIAVEEPAKKGKSK